MRFCFGAEVCIVNNVHIAVYSWWTFIGVPLLPTFCQNQDIQKYLFCQDQSSCTVIRCRTRAHCNGSGEYKYRLFLSAVFFDSEANGIGCKGALTVRHRFGFTQLLIVWCEVLRKLRPSSSRRRCNLRCCLFSVFNAVYSCPFVFLTWFVLLS